MMSEASRPRERRSEKEADRTDDREKRRKRERETDRSPRREDGKDVRRRAGSRSPKPERNSHEASKPSGSGRPRVEEANGEVSMSVEETNRVRVSLGLKPLAVTKNSDGERAAAAQAAAERAEAAEREKEAKVAERVRSHKEKRLEQENLRKVKTLGEAGRDVDDLGAWVERSRIAEAKSKEQERLKAAKLARQLEEQDDVDSEDEEQANPQELAGMKVKHGADELNEGETMVLTLADRSILDDRGEIDEAAEELENALATEDKLRKKAIKAATKQNKPLFEEDGERRGLLDKYDEEEQEAGMQIDASGAVNEAKLQRQEEVRARLRAAESAATSSMAAYSSQGDYFTKDEMERFQKPKAKKKRKLRKKESEDVGVDVAALEAEAAALDPAKDRGSRTQRIARDAEQAAATAAEESRRKERYENAMNKANIASLALRKRQEEEYEEDDADEDLQASLARARRAAQLKVATQPSDAAVAAEAARRREEREEREREMGGGLEFSEAKDFASSIQLVKPEDEQPAANGDHHAAMDVEEEPVTAPTPLPPLPPPPPSPGGSVPRPRGWTSAGAKAEKMDTDLPPAPVIKKEEPQTESLVREKHVGTGLAGAMAMLRDRGEFKQGVQWSGRTNDMKKGKLQGLGDVYTGGQHEDKLAADIEQALTQRDEFGRVLTPKERFRDLCHNFHGKTMSKTKQEKRLRKLQEEVDSRRAATAEGTSNSFTRLGGQQMAGTPYKVLSGKVQPGQSSDPASGFATVDRQTAVTPFSGGATPRLGGGTTPLVGDRKVEAMLGMKREGQGRGAERMPPPAPVNVRK